MHEAAGGAGDRGPPGEREGGGPPHQKTQEKQTKPPPRPWANGLSSTTDNIWSGRQINKSVATARIYLDLK